MLDLLERYPGENFAPMIANALAVDLLRKLNVRERPGIMAEIESRRPDVADLIRRDYPHHAQGE